MIPYDSRFDPIAKAINETWLEPSLKAFPVARPDATEVEAQAFVAAVYTYGMSLVLIARLTAGLDQVKPEPSKLGGMLGNFTFTPSQKDTLEMREQVAQLIRANNPILPPQPPQDDKWPGQYL